MSITYGFYNSVDEDRVYNANHLNTLFDGIIQDGVFSTWENAFHIQSSSEEMMVLMGTGKAWLDNTWTINDTPELVGPFEAVTVSTLSRIDAVVITVDKESRENKIEIVQGTQALTPSKPYVAANQYPIAYVTILYDVSLITNEHIENVTGQERIAQPNDKYSGGTPFVTGLLQQLTIDQILSQWDAAFNAWFEDMRDILDEEAATHLQNEIDTMITYGTEPLTSQSPLPAGKVYFQYEE